MFKQPDKQTNKQTNIYLGRATNKQNVIKIQLNLTNFVYLFQHKDLLKKKKTFLFKKH